MGEASPPSSNKNRRRLLLIGMGALLALVLLAVVLAPVASSMLRQFTGSSMGALSWAPQSSGQSLPFRTLREIAEQEALKIDKEAEFGILTVSSPGSIFGPAYSGPATGSLELLFSYFTPSGNRIDIWMEDAAPTSTLKIYSSDNEATADMGRLLYGQALEGRSERGNLYDSVEKNPRDAVASTWEDASRYAGELGIPMENVYPVVSIDHLWGMPGKWTVQYWPKGDTTNPESTEQGVSALAILSGISVVAEYLVDGKTGAILRYKHGGHITTGPQLTPNPPRSPTPAK